MTTRSSITSAREPTGWAEVMSLNPTHPEAYARIAELVDLNNFADYMIGQLYVHAAGDWPVRNWTAYRDRTDGKFRFLVVDNDLTLRVRNELWFDYATFNDIGTPGRLFNSLRSNSEFQLLFADRVQQHFFAVGALTPEQAQSRFERIIEQMEDALFAESARWGDSMSRCTNRNVPCTVDHWASERDRLQSRWFPNQTRRLLEQFRSVGLFPPLDAPQFRSRWRYGQFGISRFDFSQYRGHLLHA